MQPMPVRYVEKMRSIKLKLGIERVIVVKLTSQNLSHIIRYMGPRDCRDQG